MKEKKGSIMKVINKLLEPKNLIKLELIAGTVNLIYAITAPNERMAVPGYSLAAIFYSSAIFTHTYNKYNKEDNSKKED